MTERQYFKQLTRQYTQTLKLSIHISQLVLTSAHKENQFDSKSVKATIKVQISWLQKKIQHIDNKGNLKLVIHVVSNCGLHHLMQPQYYDRGSVCNCNCTVFENHRKLHNATPQVETDTWNAMCFIVLTQLVFHSSSFFICRFIRNFEGLDIQ